MDKRVHFNGYIDVPNTFEFGDIETLIDTRLALSGVMLEVKGEKTMKNKTSGEASARVYTLECNVVAAKWNGKFLPAVVDPEQPALDAAEKDEVGEKRAGRGRTGKEDD